VLDRVTNWKFDEIDAVFDRMTNLGNSPSSKDLPKAQAHSPKSGVLHE
jgi:hypothetical protein